MQARSFLVAMVLVIGLSSRSDATLINFNSNNGGFTATTLLMNPGGTGTPWTHTTGSDCWGGQGCWLVLDYANVSLQALNSPQYLATGPVALAFDETFNEESGGSTAYDGGVIEISVNHGAFTDVVARYGAFAGQSYTKTMSTGWGNPLPGRQALSGANAAGFGVFVTASITLPLSNGDEFQLRWLQGTDSSSTAHVPNGWILDNVSLDFGSSGPALGGPGAPASSAPEPGSLLLAAAGIAAIVLRRSLYSY
jgi:hypothetical protein